MDNFVKITIPEQHREHFQGNIVYITRWKKPTLLLMNQNENIEFQEILQGSRVCIKDGTFENLRADIMELRLDGGMFYIPSFMDGVLIGETREFERGKAGLVIR